MAVRPRGTVTDPPERVRRSEYRRRHRSTASGGDCGTLASLGRLWGACQFQIHDGPNPTNREHRYGIYRCAADGTIGGLKPVAYTVPREEVNMIAATFVISRSDLIPHPSFPDQYAVRYPRSEE